ncbi:MAG: T9SS type A sorting domain-containing protein [candidate division Zixibacteria bacterium]|nr:T9SS type A sorting domain-containing protein [candidate division Zixibacteria bacterium]
MKTLFLILISVVITASSSIANATIINIPDDYSTIQAGINNSSDSDTILVQPGIYYETINFAGRNITLTSLFLFTGDTSYVHSTVIDANSWGSAVTIEYGEDSTTLLCGFTIRDGYNIRGGGLYIENSNPKICYNFITDNTAHPDENWNGLGGGIFCYQSDITLIGNTITGNSAYYDGGGICISASNPVIIDNTFNGNSAMNGAGIYGGYCEPLISGNLIYANISDGLGGGIYFRDVSPDMTNNTICSNSAYWGGGIYCEGASTLQMTNNILWYDNAVSQGNELYLDDEVYPLIDFCNIQDTLWPGEGNISIDPLFRDPCNGDFHLQDSINCADSSYSPCIDAGDPVIKDLLLDCARGLGTLRSDMGAYGGGLEQPPVAVGMIPRDTPITVPAGGSFMFNGVLQNNIDIQMTGDVWVTVFNREYNYSHLVEVYHDIPISPNQRIVISDIIQQVPVWAPPGMYDYIAYAGIYPSVKIDSSSFEFEVATPLDNGSGSWAISGWFEDENGVESPSEITLLNNYPNPFNATTVVSFDLAESGNVKLEVYNLMGQRVEILVDGFRESGHHNINWDASSYSSGIYFFKLSAWDRSLTKQMTILK